MESPQKMLDKVTMSLNDLDTDDIDEIIKHMPDVSFSEILESPYLYKLALIYAARGSHRKFMRKLAIAAIGIKDTDNLGQLEIRNKISSALKETNCDSLRKLLESDSEGMSTLVGKSGYDLISSVLLCDCSPELFEFVLMQVASINHQSVDNNPSMFNGIDSHGLTPLISAVLSGNLVCMEHLLEKGADVDVPDARWPIEKQPEETEDKHDAKRKRKQKSSSQDILSGTSKTALMYAVCTGNSDCVKVLLRYKPNLKKKCFSNLTAFSYAAITSSYDCLELLLTTPVEMDKSELMGSAANSECTNSTKSGGFLFGDSFYFTATSDNRRTGMGSVKTDADLKRKKDNSVKNFDEDKDSNSSPGEELENDNESDNKKNESADNNAHSASSKEASKMPFSFDFSGKQGVATDEENITKNVPFSFNVLQPKFTIGDCAPNSRHSKHKSRSKYRPKRDKNLHNTDFLKQLLDTNERNSDDTDINNMRAIAEASLPYAVLGNDVKCLKLLLSHCGNLGCKDKFGKTPLMLAAERGKTDFVEALLENWAGVDSPVSLGMQETALMLAAQNGHGECVTALLKHHANTEALNWCKETPLMYAAKNGRVECLRILLEHKADVQKFNSKEQSPLMIAVESGNVECIQLLLEHGSVVHAADWCQKNVFMYAAESSNVEILDMMIKAVIKQYECQASTMQNEIKQVVSENSDVDLNSGLESSQSLEDNSHESHEVKRRMVDEGEQPETEKKEKSAHEGEKKEAIEQTVTFLAEKALPYSVRGEKMECFEMLLPHCTNFNRMEYTGKKTALMLAVQKGHLEYVKLLIKHGADVSFTSEATGKHGCKSGTSAVVCATIAKNMECLELLLENGAGANDGYCHDMSLSNQNAAIVATRHKDVDCLKLLVKHGADITSKDADDLSALTYALSDNDKESQECLKIMISNGKQIDISEFYLDRDFRILCRYPDNLELLIKDGALIMSKEIKELSERKCQLFSLRDQDDVTSLKLLMEYRLFDWKLWWDDEQAKEILFVALLAGISPKKLFDLDDRLVSPFEFALVEKKEEILRYLLTNLYFTTEDYQSFTSKYTREKSESEGSDTSWLDTTLKTRLCDNPWRLETLCLLTVSSSLLDNNVSSQIPRAKQVESLPIPQKFKTILKFDRPYARLCTEHWSGIGRAPDILCLSKPTHPSLDTLSSCNRSSCPFQGVGLNTTDKYDSVIQRNEINSISGSSESDGDSDHS